MDGTQKNEAVFAHGCFWQRREVVLTLTAHSVMMVLWKYEPWGWTLVFLVLCWDWDIKHRGPWESNESVPLCNPELMAFILALAFTVQIQSSQRDETTDGHYRHLTCPSIVLPAVSTETGWLETTTGRKSYRVFPSTEAMGSKMSFAFSAMHNTLANGTKYKNFESCQYFKEHMLKTWLLTFQNLVCNICLDRMKSRIKIASREHDLKKTYLFLKCLLRNNLSNMK